MPESKRRLLFVCVGNSCRSQMAEGFARALLGDSYEIFSAGTAPQGFVAPFAIDVMDEVCIDISKHYSKGLCEVPKEPYEAVVTMGCGDACPWILARIREDWNIEDPFGETIGEYRRARDEIRRRILQLKNLLESEAPDERS